MKRTKNNVEYFELVNKTDEPDANFGAIYNPPLVETVINEGDTLQSISIKFHCPVAELKRINNIHRDNEIYARRMIKVPFRPFSMVHKSGDSSPNSTLLKKSVNPIDLKQKLVDVGTTTDEKLFDIDRPNETIEKVRLSDKNKSSSLVINQIIFNTKISSENVSNSASLQDNFDDESDEKVQLLPQSALAETNHRVTKRDKFCDWDCSGSDWGLSWPILLAIVLLVSFIGPLIYVFYIYEHPEEFHHHGS